jgi:DNA-binding HxlR family transcriptional regulator
MLPSGYPGQVCSIARALEVVGERWSLLILRDAYLGVRRFSEFRRSLGVARNVLTARLDRLCEEGLLERRRYNERSERFEYVLTDKGRELAPVLLQLMKWGDRHYPAEGGPPRLTEHRGCGGQVDEWLVCDRCGQQVTPDAVAALPGPGLRAA